MVQTPTEENSSKSKSSKPGSYTRTRNYKNSDCKGISSTQNRYNVLLTLSELQLDDPLKPQKKLTSHKQSSGGSNKCHKIIIIRDSHAKGCAAEIKQALGKTGKVVGYVKPGSNLKNIKNIANKEIQELTKKDVVVLWGGTNDIARNESNKGLTHLTNFVAQRKNTNIILVNAPKTHALADTSCVNDEVTKFNRKMIKKMKVYDHVNVINSVNQRECYTRHGLHLNSLGKELMAQKLSI